MLKHRYIGLFLALLLLAGNISVLPEVAQAAQNSGTNTLAGLTLAEGQAFVLHYQQLSNGRLDWEIRLTAVPQGSETLEYTIHHQPSAGGAAKVLHSGAMTALTVRGRLDNVAPGDLYIVLRSIATQTDADGFVSSIQFCTSFGPFLELDQNLPPHLQIVSPLPGDEIWGNETELLLTVQTDPFFPVYLQGADKPVAATSDGYAEAQVSLPSDQQIELEAFSVGPTGHVSTCRQVVHKHLLTVVPSVEGAFSRRPTVRLYLPDVSLIDLHQSTLSLNEQAVMLRADSSGAMLYATPAEDLPAGLTIAHVQLIGRSDKFGGQQPVLESYAWQFLIGGSRTVQLWPGKYSASINGESYNLAAAPFIDSTSASTMVPFRFVAEAMGAEVGWLPVTRQVSFTLNGHNIVLTLDSPVAEVDGEAVRMSVAPRLLGSHTVIPLRFVSEQLGAFVNWDEATRTITITTVE